MDCNQNFQEHEAQSQYNHELALDPKRNYTLLASASSEEDSESSDNCFDCNICLDSAQDPVVTLCGHLYCYSCIFEWLNVQTSSSETPFHQGQSCPVCKATISHASLVPLHSRCSSLAEQEEKRSRLGFSRLQGDQSDVLSPLENLGASMNDPAQVMIGELFHRRILWSFMGFFVDPFPNSYYALTNRTPRMRRQEMQVDKSLNRVSIFLLCCLILCLFTF